jgi:hypothetical protein
MSVKLLKFDDIDTPVIIPNKNSDNQFYFSRELLAPWIGLTWDVNDDWFDTLDNLGKPIVLLEWGKGRPLQTVNIHMSVDNSLGNIDGFSTNIHPATHCVWPNAPDGSFTDFWALSVTDLTNTSGPVWSKPFPGGAVREMEMLLSISDTEMETAQSVGTGGTTNLGRAISGFNAEVVAFNMYGNTGVTATFTLLDMYIWGTYRA